MRKIFLLILIILFTNVTFSQSGAGTVGVGLRSTLSFFDHDVNAKIGYGVGGQYRIQIMDHLNTEWFLDYLQQDLGDAAFRKDIHIGVSVMYYPWLQKNREKIQIVKPYLAVGYCFDWSELVVKDYRNTKGSKFGSAIQAGIGTHINLSKRLDFTVLGQYMIHLGKDVQLTYDDVGHQHGIKTENHTAAYGHLLLTMGINYKLFKLWKTKD